MGERNMDGEDSVRTVDCLRGRLLAERAASKDAKEEAQQLEDKLMELEKLLKQEAKSRNKAEKKLKFLMKKLGSINVSHVSDESEYISSTSSITKEEQESNHQTRISEPFENQELKGKKDLGNLKTIDTQNCSVSLSDDSSTDEGTSSIEFKGLECEMRRDKDVTTPRIGKIVEQRNGTFKDSLSSASEKWSSDMDQQSDFCCSSIRSSANEGIKRRNTLFEDSLSSASDQQSGFSSHSIRSSADERGQDSDSQVDDDSMALVLVDTSQRTHRIDPEALDASVREVLNTLRQAKEELRSSMERRRMKVIGVTVKTSTIFI